MVDPSHIEGILFDMNGTLRVRELHEPTQRAAISKLVQFIGKEDIDWNELALRHKAYGNWAQSQWIQLSEAEIWSQWILPDYPRERIEPLATELMLAWSERKGRTVPIPDAEATLVELRHRGYRLGVISNTMSTLDIPRSLDAFGWRYYFDVVILSSELKIRKPSPEPYREAARRMKLTVERCAYVGNRISKDIPGCKQAGFALGIIVEPANGSRTDELSLNVMPDITIKALSELLEIFPDKNRRLLT